MALHPTYECHCPDPRPMTYMGEDTGLCIACHYVYDPDLYERRLRQHANVRFEENETLEAYLKRVDPNYPKD